MASTQREERRWALAWIVVGIPAMAAGCIQGYRHGDDGLMVGTAIVSALILGINLPILRGPR
jgi:hypothetical protein